MIKLTSGNLLECKVEALVNTVNCDGFMGKGIALQFKQAFPSNYKAYHRACKLGQVQPGKMFVFENSVEQLPKYIINFPTKRHWREKSRLEDIKAGLDALVLNIQNLNIRSIAIPPLGCGLGGLEWNIVKSLIQEALATLSEVEVFIYEPTGSPAPKDMPINTERKMTLVCALLIFLIKRYKEFDYSLTLLEIQKLAYFIQGSGQNLKLIFEKHKYGPYAHGLSKVLEAMESHYTSGFGDQQTSMTKIELLPGAYDEAQAFLQQEANIDQSLERLKRVTKLIEGFETPYSIELLATVHWLSHHEEPVAKTLDEVIQAVHKWSDRKKSRYSAEHIEIAWGQLVEKGWIEPFKPIDKEYLRR